MRKTIQVDSRGSGFLPRFLLIVLMFVASLPVLSIDYYQGVILEKPGFNQKDKVYNISNRANLLWWVFNGREYGIVLENDIDLQDDGKTLLSADGKTLAMDPKEILVWPEVKGFSKIIYGKGHTIRGVYQNGGDNVGFLSSTSETFAVYNLNIADSYLCGKVAGGFLGQKEKSLNTDQTEFERCSFRGYVKGTQYAGGIVGWYRTDGQDARFYRCTNYGTVQSGSADSKDTDTGAGGMIGYFDICHTAFAKAHAWFDRCVNYGNISCLTHGGNVGGQIGKVWDNNNGKREWRFCFNFGDVNKYSNDGTELKGSGLIGNYNNVNGNAQPKILCCGNAKPADTGTLLDSCQWNYKGHEPLVLQGIKTVQTQKALSSMTKDDTWAAWMSNNWGFVVAAGVILVATIVTAGLALAGVGAGSYTGANAAATTVNSAAVVESVFGFTHMANSVAFAQITAASVSATVAAAALGIATAGAAAIGLDFAVAGLYNKFRAQTEYNNAAALYDFVYANGDIKRGYFAFDANAMMKADSIGGEKNYDHSPLFKQAINKDDAQQNEELPEVVSDGNDIENKLYFGYDKCNPTPLVCNDPTLLKSPSRDHTFDDNGECKYCHTTQIPLTAVMKSDNKTVDYYKIESYANLRYLSAVFNGEIEDKAVLQAYREATFKVMNDIKAPSMALWTPIASSIRSDATTTASDEDTVNDFRGTFDGQGHTISGLRTNLYTDNSGLFGTVGYHAVIKNVRLSDCTFLGEHAGSIAGKVLNEPSVQCSRIAVDNDVIVASSGRGSSPCAGGFFGWMPAHRININNSYSNANVIGSGENCSIGMFAGEYGSETDGKYTTSEKKIHLYGQANGVFEYCYFGGSVSSSSLSYSNKVIGKTMKNDFDYRTTFYHCFAVNTNSGLFPSDFCERLQTITSRYVTRSYIKSGRLAYDLMLQSHTDKDGYFYTQTGDYPEFVTGDTKTPQLCKIKVITNYYDGNSNVALGDTLVNMVHGKKLELPFSFAGYKFDNVVCGVIYAGSSGFANLPEYDLGSIYNMYEQYTTDFLPGKGSLAIWVNANTVGRSDDFDITNNLQWKTVPTINGSKKANLIADLNLTGANEWTMLGAPTLLEGNYHTVRSNVPLMTQSKNVNNDVTIQNLRLVGDTLCRDITSDEKTTLKLNNIIFQGYDRNFIRLDNNTANNNHDNFRGKDLFTYKQISNVVVVSPDSSMLYVIGDVNTNGTDVTFPSKETSTTKRQNTYEDILGYMLERDWLGTFGLRLDGANEKVAGKFGFATDPGKRIYRAKLYRQANGLADGEVLMNYDGKIIFDVKDNTLGDMHTDGIPAGKFAILPVTKAELGEMAFASLPVNAMTSDGYATCISLDDQTSGGFAYPVDLGSDVTIRASRAEYIRNVYRDGFHETLCLPFAFGSLEIADGELGKDDKLDICYLDPNNGGIDSKNNVVRLKSYFTYINNKYSSADYDSSKDTQEKQLDGGVPYLLSLACQERADQKTKVTFVGVDVELLREPSDVVAPLYGSFKQTVAGELANNNMMLVLGVFDDEQAESGKCEKFVRVSNDYHLSPFRAYLMLPNATRLNGLSLSIDDNGGTTGIGSVDTDAANGNARTYDLSGRRIGNAYKGQVYIKNGKKVINLK